MFILFLVEPGYGAPTFRFVTNVVVFCFAIILHTSEPSCLMGRDLFAIPFDQTRDEGSMFRSMFRPLFVSGTCTLLSTTARALKLADTPLIRAFLRQDACPVRATASQSQTRAIPSQGVREDVNNLKRGFTLVPD